MGSKRRREYLPISNPKYEVYHHWFDKFRVLSPILNSGARMVDIHTLVDGSEQGIRNTLAQKVGSEMPAIQEEIEELLIRFREYQQQCVNEGREIPAEMPQEMLNKCLKLEAKQDIVTEEIEYLRLLLNKKPLSAKEKEVPLLPYGPVGTGHFHGTRAEDPLLINLLREIDGQDVKTIDGQLIIVDKRSPYKGMAVVDYRRLCQEWHDHRLQERKEAFEKAKDIAKKEGKPILSMGIVSTHRPIPKDEWPLWPSFAKRWPVDGETTKKGKAK